MYYLSYETEVKSRGRKREDFKKANNREEKKGVGKRGRQKGGALREEGLRGR